MSATAVVLPELDWMPSPNFSERSPGIIPYLIVAHRPVGSYHGSAKWLCEPKAQASAHVLTEGNGTEVDTATQLVAWDKKAWACASFNSASYNIEVDDNAWDGTDRGAFAVAARIFAFICLQTGIPPVWSKDPLRQAGDRPPPRPGHGRRRAQRPDPGRRRSGTRSSSRWARSSSAAASARPGAAAASSGSTSD